MSNGSSRCTPHNIKLKSRIACARTKHRSAGPLRHLTGCYAPIRRIVAALVLLYVGSTFANESPAERVTAYLAAFNSDSDMEQVSSEYWFSEMVLNPGQQSPVHLPGSTLAKQFESLRSGLKEA